MMNSGTEGLQYAIDGNTVVADVPEPVIGHELNGDAAGAGTASAVFCEGW